MNSQTPSASVILFANLAKKEGKKRLPDPPSG
jgi:hypothetical protein